MSRTWSVDYSKMRPGMPPGRFALAMRRLAKRRRLAAREEDPDDHSRGVDPAARD